MAMQCVDEPVRYDFGELLIGGEWRNGHAGTKFTDVDPYTGETLVEVGQANVSDVNAAFAAAIEVQHDWAETPPGHRSDILRRAATILENRKAEVVDWLIRESGSVRRKAEIEWSDVRAILLEAATGTTLKKAQLELGGNNPLVVLDDADLNQAVDAAVFGRFFHQGEICMSANRIIVEDSLHDRFVEAFTERVKALKYGDPNDPATAIGPVINQHQLDGLNRKIAEAYHDGATLRAGGPAEGLVLPPHVFTDITDKVRLGREEIFGPIAPVIRARDEADALRIANDTEYGLSSAVLTSDLLRGERFAQGMQAGMTHINDMPVVDLPNMPFGGEKNSGLGRFGAEGVTEHFTTEHWISVQNVPRKYLF